MKRFITFLLLVTALFSFGRIPMSYALGQTKVMTTAGGAIEHYNKAAKYTAFQLVEFDNEAEDDVQSSHDWYVPVANSLPTLQLFIPQNQTPLALQSHRLNWTLPKTTPLFIQLCNYRL